MFGNKQNKANRLQQIVERIRSNDGPTNADLARNCDVQPSTITKDMGIVESLLNVRLWEDDDGRYYVHKDEG
jgi:predicted DNA-binding transcriptional regulator YafY